VESSQDSGNYGDSFENSSESSQNSGISSESSKESKGHILIENGIFDNIFDIVQSDEHKDSDINESSSSHERRGNEASAKEDFESSSDEKDDYDRSNSGDSGISSESSQDSGTSSEHFHRRHPCVHCF
jgi:hypothetical protein